MADALPYLSGLALISFGVFRWAALRGKRSETALRHAHRFAFCLGAALLVLAPATARTLERAVDLPGLPMLVGDVLRTLAVSCLGLLACRSVRRQAVAAGLTLLTLVTLFASAHVRHSAGELLVDAGDRSVLAAYDMTLILYPAWHLTALGRALLRRSRRTGPGTLRTGMRLLVAGTAVGVAWTAWGLDDVRLALLTGRQSDGDDPLSIALGLLCAALVVSGGSAAAWPWLRHRWWTYRTYRELTPLWSALHRAFPDIALPHPRPRPGIRFALYRRVIEIHDGLLLLRPHLHAPPHPEPDTAATTAARISAALRAPAPTTGFRPGPLPLPTASGTGTDAEASQLAEISRSFARLTTPGAENS
ncbi:MULTISPECIES: MAB_1171c family putative transporter [unclassified Streptomyces]|uniref:MAB_1171c family putative transporter n=1 Tax=unclassified Streptomyces TaxID=2593676 RepID=UPI00381139AC